MKTESLRRELLLSFAILVGAALSLAVVTALIAQAFQPRLAPLILVALILADVGIVFAFGRYLLDRLVLRPVAMLHEAADQLAEGNLDHRAPPAETREFTELADRFNRMTERLQEIQRQLVRTEKLATVGRLAAGVAHEVGNPLAAIGTYVEVLQKRGVDPEIAAALAREAGRIDRIVRGLLDYARPGDQELGLIDLAAVIVMARDLLEHQGVLKGIDLHVELDGAPLLVRGKAHALEQVVVNLLLNAVDAAPSGPIVIGATRWRFEARSTGQRRSDPAVPPYRRTAPPSPRPWRPELEPGAPGVLLYVADAGPGVPAADREKVFEPFHTTKPPGQGTGLGLAIVQRTIHELGGVVWVEQAREGGAAFKIFLLLGGGP
jgi:hypothetical protein